MLQLSSRVLHKRLLPSAAAAALSTTTRPRPISPHVTIYKFPLSALSSIAHRVTGVTLSAAFISVGVLGAAGVNVAHVVHAIHELGPLVVLPLKAAVGFPLAYHASAGVRHLFWDHTGRGLENIAEVDKSVYAVIGATMIGGTALTLL